MQSNQKILFFLIIVICGVLISLLSLPAYPKQWDAVKIGMNDKQVVQLLPNIGTTSRDMKGMDFIIDRGDIYSWHLHVIYDNELKVERIEKKLIYQSFGFLNRSIINKR